MNLFQGISENKIILSVVFVTEPEDEENFCRSRSIGMTLVNLCVIEEDDQNEIQSFHSDNTPTNAAENSIVRNALLAYKANEAELKRQYQLHLIWAGLSKIRAKTVEMEIQWLNLHQPMLTILYRTRQHCVTNKNRIHLLDNGGWMSADERNFVSRNNQTTIGDDLCDFVRGLNDSRKDTVVNTELRYSFHFSLIPDILYFSIVRGGFLSNKDLKSEVDDQKFINSFSEPFPDVKEKLKSGRKYAFSSCFRKTEVIWKNKSSLIHSSALHEKFQPDL